MRAVGKLWSSLVLTLTLYHVAESVVATEWSLSGHSDEYVMAVISVNYTDPKTNQTTPSSVGGEIGKFGMGRVAAPASGRVVHVLSNSTNETSWNLNHHGCGPHLNHLTGVPWIALIKRGECNFDRKLEIARAHGAVAMVVYDRDYRDVLEKMGLSNCRNCTIPGVFTYRKIGEELANATERGLIVNMHIAVGETCTRPYSGINRTSVLFVSISFIVLMIISLAWLVFYYVQRFRYLHAKDRLAQRLCNAAKKALAKIPTRNVKLTDKELSGDAECCAVCIEFYASGDVLRTLPCRHEFHKGCVDPWLLEHRTCPMCKMDILKYYGFIFTGSQESILHLDLEDGNLNSSDSRESESPSQDHLTHLPVRYAEPSASSSAGDCPQHRPGDTGTRKSSLISLTMVPSQRSDPPTLCSPSGSGGCKCRCACEKALAFPSFQHPMCYMQVEGEDSATPTHHHKPIIHREDSGLQRQPDEPRVSDSPSPPPHPQKPSEPSSPEGPPSLTST